MEFEGGGKTPTKNLIIVVGSAKEEINYWNTKEKTTFHYVWCTRESHMLYWHSSPAAQQHGPINVLAHGTFFQFTFVISAGKSTDNTADLCFILHLNLCHL